MISAVLCGIFIAPRARQPLAAVREVRAVPGVGLEGDRYGLRRGSMSRWPGPARQVSLIEQEAIDLLLAEHSIDLDDGRSRRNLVTRGIALADLIKRRFRIGDVLLRGAGPCLPCRHLERLTQPGVFEALKGRGGLRAEVLEEGTLRVGDPIVVEAE
jgi:MOSC domain-containing protein YiiM